MALAAKGTFLESPHVQGRSGMGTRPAVFEGARGKRLIWPRKPVGATFETERTLNADSKCHHSNI